jgi:predicted dehydrogenase
MTPRDPQAQSSVSRRRFLQRSSLAVAATAAASEFGFTRAVHADGPELEIKIGVVGCGGRGTGALLDALGAATKIIYPKAGFHTEDVAKDARLEREGIKVVALADLFDDRIARCVSQLEKLDIKVPQEMRFVGIDAYKKLLAVPEINYVIFATPPHFRPVHLKACIEAGKHAFIEKPVAVDPTGVRAVIEAGLLAKQKGLGIAAGTQRRHTLSYQETIKRIHDGAIGDLVYGRCYWDGSEIWVITREPGWTDLEYQFRNWPYFTWLSGDHYVEQHIHNIDVMNWVLGGHPIKAVAAVGGRQVRTGPKYGHIFDHFAVEFEYPNDVRMFSQARQINGCESITNEGLTGTLGTSNCHNEIRPKTGDGWRFRGKDTIGYKQEHEDLIASIRAGKPMNVAQTVAESTMTAIMGREAAYSGKSVTWEAAMESTMRLGPTTYEFGPYPVPEVAMPGRYRFS